MAEKKILVVEDSALVVLSLEGLFEDMNWKMEGPAARLDEALELAETTRADIALLDINLDGENSWPAAERLRDRGIPIVFATGYDGESLLPKSFAGTPVVMKPFSITQLEALLRSIVQEHEQAS